MRETTNDRPAATKPRWTPAMPIREAYEFFNERRDRTEPFDEGDDQNIHAWMLAVTEWIEKEELRRAY